MTDEGHEPRRGPERPDHPVLDATLRALAAPERRAALGHLLREEEAELAALADVVTGATAAARGETATRSDRERVATALHHVHLPHLADAGLVEYDETAGTTTLSAGEDERRRLRALLAGPDGAETGTEAAADRETDAEN